MSQPFQLGIARPDFRVLLGSDPGEHFLGLNIALGRPALAVGARPLDLDANLGPPALLQALGDEIAAKNDQRGP